MGAIQDTGAANENDEALVSEVVNESAVQAQLDKTGGAVTAYANVNDTIGGNLVGRKGVRVLNEGKSIKWRIAGEITGNNGENIGKNEAVDFPYGENIVIELRESNGDNELKVIITEYK